MGKDNSKLCQHFEALGYDSALSSKKRFVDTHSLQEAVDAAYQYAEAGDTVLLSPCCASFDLFTNYEDRGEKFMNAVRSL
jgi:UDP-N-acetylmuramoylalanine--D-glutamate ligase